MIGVTMIHRREFILGLSGLCANLAACQEANISPQSQTVNKMIGFQTYSLRESIKADPQTVLQLIKDAGYDYVELNRQNFDLMAPHALKSMLNNIGLASPASHISVDMLSDISELVSLSKVFEFEYVIVPYIEPEQRSLQDWRALAKSMDVAGAQLRQEGIRLAYHNHEFEFDDLGGGTTAMEVLLNDANPDHLDFEIDLFWAALVDINIPELFKQYPGRFKLCHIKDMGSNKAEFRGAEYEDITRNLMKNVGEGIIDFDEILGLNNLSGLEYFIAEHDNPRKPYKASITTSYNTINRILN